MSNTNRRLTDDPDLTYEYLPGDSVGNSRSTETLNKPFTTNFADTSLLDQIKYVTNIYRFLVIHLTPLSHEVFLSQKRFF